MPGKKARPKVQPLPKVRLENGELVKTMEEAQQRRMRHFAEDECADILSVEDMIACVQEGQAKQYNGPRHRRNIATLTGTRESTPDSRTPLGWDWTSCRSRSLERRASKQHASGFHCS